MKSIAKATVIILLVTSCTHKAYKVNIFTEEKLIWFKPFTKTESVIYASTEGERDTIIFKAPKDTSYTTRDIIRGGNSTTISKIVTYDFSKGSYHQFSMMSDGKKRYRHRFVYSSKSSNGHTSVEITFIGTFFSGDNVFPDDNKLNNIQKIDSNTYYFDSKKANYSGVNVEKGIKSFTFNPSIGVTDFVDDRNIKWTRQ